MSGPMVSALSQRTSQEFAMDVSSLGSPPLPTPLDRLKASLQRSLERSGPGSLYSRMLKAEIARYETVLKTRGHRLAEPQDARMARDG